MVHSTVVYGYYYIRNARGIAECIFLVFEWRSILKLKSNQNLVEHQRMTFLRKWER